MTVFAWYDCIFLIYQKWSFTANQLSIELLLTDDRQWKSKGGSGTFFTFLHFDEAGALKHLQSTGRKRAQC